MKRGEKESDCAVFVSKRRCREAARGMLRRGSEREEGRDGGSDRSERKTGRGKERKKQRGRDDRTGFVLITSEGKKGGEKQRLCSLDRHFGSNGVFTYQIKPLTQTARSELGSHR